MSSWTHIQGVISIEPCGRTTAENEFLLKTTLSHLPEIMGSEGGLDYFINKVSGWTSSSSHDEFGVYAGYRSYNKVNMNYFTTKERHSPRFDMIETTERFVVTIYGSLRDVEFEDGLRMLNKWLCRLAKRMWVYDMFICINGDSYQGKKDEKNPYGWCEKQKILTDESCCYGRMTEDLFTVKEVSYIDKLRIKQHRKNGGSGWKFIGKDKVRVRNMDAWVNKVLGELYGGYGDVDMEDTEK